MPALSTLKTDAHTVYYRVYHPESRGISLVCLHGYADDSTQFAPLADSLPNHPLFCPDFPMIHDGAPQSVTSLTTFTLKFINALRLPDKFILVGFSLGGIVAANGCTQLEPPAKHLFLLNTPHQFPLSTFRRRFVDLVTPALRSPHFCSLLARLQTDPLLRRLAGLPPFSSLEAPTHLRHHSFALINTLASVLPELKFDPTAFRSQPTTLIYAQDDHLVQPPPPGALTLSPHVSIKIIPAGGHANSPAYWPQVAALIEPILQSAGQSVSPK